MPNKNVNLRKYLIRVEITNDMRVGDTIDSDGDKEREKARERADQPRGRTYPPPVRGRDRGQFLERGPATEVLLG